jgi:dTDP-4-amino-4,6-dideoxygalactose transaminase
MKKTKNNIGVKVPFFPAAIEYASIMHDLHDALDEVGRSGRLIFGQKVNTLENTIAKLMESKYCVTCASGTDAIMLSLKALGIKSGDEVIVPANAYPTVFGVVLAGAIPKLIDVKNETGNLNPKLLKDAITKKTKAVILVHLYGLAADIHEVKKICKQKGVYLIEDCAQAFGSMHKGSPVGSFGDISILSFYPTKNLGALGDGGAIVTSIKKVHEKLLMLRMYGEKKRYDSELLSGHSRLDELQAAFLLKKLRKLNGWITRRKRLAKIYMESLSNIKNLSLPIDHLEEHTYHLFVVQTEYRDELQLWLSKNGIETGIHYPKSIHLTKTFSFAGKVGDFPVSEKHNRTVLSLPMHQFLTYKQIKYVSSKIVDFFETIS